MTKQSLPAVKGKPVDGFTRCVHYHSLLDVIAIKFKCCGDYFPCYQCHQECSDHEPQIWTRTETDTQAVLCGVCKHEMTIREYLNCGNRCPSCKAAFNPACSQHYHLYFEI